MSLFLCSWQETRGWGRGREIGGLAAVAVGPHGGPARPPGRGHPPPVPQ